MYLSASGIVACDRSCICVLVESLLPVIGHVFVFFLNLCDLLSVMYFSAMESLWPVISHVFVCFLNLCNLLLVMYLSANGIVVACDRSCICVLVESLWPVIGHVFVCLLNRCGL